MTHRRAGWSQPRENDHAATAADAANTLVKGLALLRAFRGGDWYLGNKQLAERTGLTRPTVSRLAGTLVQLGYMRYSSSLGKYALGTGVLALAYPMLAGLPIRQIARPLMKELADAIDGQVSMGMASGCNMVFIETSRSPRHRHTLPETGAAIPMIASAMGRAYLAAIGPVAREAAMERLRVNRPVEWQTYRDKVVRAVQDCARLGFTRSAGDIRPELHACAVPLATRVDDEIVVVNCSVQANRLKRGELERSVGPQLVAVARQIDGAMGLSIEHRAA